MGIRCADTLYPLKLALTSPTSGGRSVGIVRLRTKSPGVYGPGDGKVITFVIFIFPLQIVVWKTFSMKILCSTLRLTAMRDPGIFIVGILYN
jgi:hypothetical protein